MLINNIDKTEVNKNNTALSLNKINSKLLEMGNITATDLNNVSEILKNQIQNNYKKISIMDVSIDLDSAGGWWNAVCDIPINLSFNPTRIFIRYDVIEKDTQVTGHFDVDSKYATATDMDNYSGINDFAIISFNSKNIHVEHTHGNSADGVGFARVKKIIAIG